jgi:Beta-lactamase enzyme family
MKKTTNLILFLIICVASIDFSCSQSEKNNLLLQLLRNRPDLFQHVLEKPEEFRLQILYTQINRDQNNHPQFISYSYRVNQCDYFYPASTVKMPASLLALEKLNNLNIPGLDKYTPLRIDSAYSGQTRVEIDTTAVDSLPNIAHYIKKIFLVSDNDAYNRLYEFLGQQYITETLRKKGYQHTHLIRRLERALSPEQNRATNPFTFYQGDQIIYQQPLTINPDIYPLHMRDIKQGKGYYKNDSLINQPMDFSNSNYFSVSDQQAILKTIIFPEAVTEQSRFNLTEDDYRFIYTYMGLRPRESDVIAYHDTSEYYDGYVKFFMYGDTKQQIPTSIRIFDKCGESYGYLIDNAYIVDFEKKIEFLLTAVIQVNQDQIYNDDQYEYEQIGFPFLANLGRIIYDYEIKRERKTLPDLSKFQVFN